MESINISQDDVRKLDELMSEYTESSGRESTRDSMLHEVIAYVHELKT